MPAILTRKTFVSTGVKAPPIDVTINTIFEQSNKFYENQPSIFSPGIWPFAPNLVRKNLSGEEIDVILYDIPKKYLVAVFRVYFNTYQFSINIADGDERNSCRHAYWIISMMQEFGEEITRKMANAHEIGRPGSHQDNCIDAINNEASINYAMKNPHVHPAKGARGMWNRGLLVGSSYEGCKEK